MAVFERSTGPFVGHRAELNNRSGKAEVFLSIDSGLAQKMMEAAVAKGGSVVLQINFDGTTHESQLFGARIDSFDAHSVKVGKFGAINFSSLAKRR